MKTDLERAYAVFSWLLLLCLLTVTTAVSLQPTCSFPAIYNFGDSNSDTGGISAAFEPIRAPYGDRFFHKPAGRDSDGRLTIDFIGISFPEKTELQKLNVDSMISQNFWFAAERVGLPYLSAYLNSLGSNFRHGANFATGGSTIRRQNETIFQYGISPFSLDMQIAQFDQFKARSAELFTQSRFLFLCWSLSFLSSWWSWHVCCFSCLARTAKSKFEREKLPRQEEFAKALYTFDIGQNDISVGFRTMSYDQLKATIPDIVSHLASAVRVRFDYCGHWKRYAMFFTFDFLMNNGFRYAIWLFAEHISARRKNILGTQHGSIRVFTRKHVLHGHSCARLLGQIRMREGSKRNGDGVQQKAQGNSHQSQNRTHQSSHHLCWCLCCEIRNDEQPQETRLQTTLFIAIQFVATYLFLKKVLNFVLIFAGFANPLKVCCGYHEKYDHIWCGNKGKVNNTEMYGGSCSNPATAVSWDGVHYTEAANKHVADRTLGGVLTDPPVPITRACYRKWDLVEELDKPNCISNQNKDSGLRLLRE